MNPVGARPIKLPWRIGLVGLGYAVPDRVRKNDDPIFDWLHKNHPEGTDLFQGYEERRVLSPGETAEQMGAQAARAALDDAGLSATDIDVLTGYVSVSAYANPNGLGQIHRDLGLGPGAHIMPVNNEFNNFNSSVLLAAGLISIGMARNVLVVCTGDWSQRVSYRTAQAVSAADGAGAVVVAATDDPDRFSIVDTETTVDSRVFGTMYMNGDELGTSAWLAWNAPEQTVRTGAYFHITDAGVEAFRTFGMHAPPETANRLLERVGLEASDVTLVSHQASTVLMDHWGKAIGPGQYLKTIENFGNLTVANIPATLAWGYERVEKDHLLLLGIGVEMQTNALLLRRGSTERSPA